MARFHFVHPIYSNAACKLDISRKFESIKKEHAGHIDFIDENRADAFLNCSSECEFSFDSFIDMFGSLRRNECIYVKLDNSIVSNDLSKTWDSFFGCLFIYSHGDIVFLFSYECADEKIDSFNTIRENYVDLFTADIKEWLLGSIKKLIDSNYEFDCSTPVHVVVGSVPMEYIEESLKKEGLTAAENEILLDSDENCKFYHGWSVSFSYQCRVEVELYCVSVILRIQSLWLYLRRLRQDVRNFMSFSLFNESSKSIESREEDTLKNLFYINSRRNDSIDFIANLKPWLRQLYNKYDESWNLSSDQVRITESLELSSKINNAAISIKLNKFQKTQSFLLFIIASLDVLAISGYIFALNNLSKNSTPVFKEKFWFVMDENFLISLIFFNLSVVFVMMVVAVYQRVFR